MYRIELSPGEETVFRSIEELAVAIKRGVITARARIYHNASNKWLPIQFHPHYKAALSMPLTQAALVAGPSVKPLSSLSLRHSAEPETPAPVAAPTPTLAASTESPVERKPASAESSKAKKPNRRPTKPRRQLRIALVGALLLGGAQWVLSAQLFSRADAPVLLRVQHQLIAMPTEAMQRVSSPNTAAMISVIPSHSAPQPAETQVLNGTHRARVPSFGGNAPAVADLPPGVEPPPSASDLAASPLPTSDSVHLKLVDSTGTKALKGIMRSVSGAQPPPRPRPKH